MTGKIESLSDGNDESFRQELEEELETVRTDNQQLHNELGNLQERKERELSQVRSQLETERADREKLEAELSGLKGKLAAALEQNEKSAPIAIGVELRSQLETKRADHSEIEAELSELKKNSAPTTTLFEKLTPDAATILSQLRARRKKSKTDLADLEAILEILES
jgi:ABC-type transporter Mla subunit MlaD